MAHRANCAVQIVFCGLQGFDFIVWIALRDSSPAFLGVDWSFFWDTDFCRRKIGASFPCGSFGLEERGPSPPFSSPSSLTLCTLSVSEFGRNTFDIGCWPRTG